MGTAGTDGFQTSLFFLAWGILVFLGLTIVAWTELILPSISEKNPDLFGIVFVSCGLIGTSMFLVLLLLNGMRKWKSANVPQPPLLFPSAAGDWIKTNTLDAGSLVTES